MENHKALSAEQSLPPRTELSAHTPGPWSTDGKWSKEWDGVCINAGHFVVATAQYLGGTDPASANARLIAAAPDLLAALSAIFNQSHPRAAYVGGKAKDYIVSKDLVDAARAAIAKATGAA
jgi:hypothetical protein